MKLKNEFSIITTKDESPTLRFKSKHAEESMHSHGGAFSETLYIYAEPFQHLKGSDLSVLSIGLGLGYNEILSVCEYLNQNPQKEFYLESYEKEEFLIEQFRNWSSGNKTALDPIYNQILKLFANKYNLEPAIIKQGLAHLLLSLIHI